MKDELLERMEVVVRYADSALANLKQSELEILKELKRFRYTITTKELVDKLSFIKNTVSKWIDNYKITMDPLCINIKEYSLVSDEVSDLIEECVLIDSLYAEVIDFSFGVIGEELSTAIRNGGRIDNIKIDDIFTLFIESLDSMQKNKLYEEDKEIIVKLMDKVNIWKRDYEKNKKLSIISFDEITKIYEYVKEISGKYKMIEDINDNYAEKIQYCYAKLEALREKELRNK